MEKRRFTNAAEAVREYIDNLDKGVIFSGYDLKNGACRYYPDGVNMYVDTFLHEMRKTRGNDYELISRSDSLYRKTTPSIKEKRKAEFARYALLKQPELFEGGCK